MKKRVLSIFLVLLMAVMLVPGVAMTASAAPSTGKIDLTGATADASGDGWTWIQSTKTFTMNGLTLNIPNHSGYGIFLPDGAKIAVYGSNTIIMNDDYDYGIKIDGDGLIYGTGSLAITAGEDRINSGDLEIRGTVTLDITTDDDGIDVNDLKVYGGNIIINAGGYGIMTWDDAVFYGGAIDISAEDYAIASNGKVYFKGSTVKAISEDDAVNADYGIYFNAGEVSLATTDSDEVVAVSVDDYIYIAAGVTVTNGVSAGASDGAGNYNEIRMTSALPVIIRGANMGINIPILPTVETPKYMPFTDVLQGAWYYDDVFYCYDNGLMDGVDTYTFAPNQSITRGMIVAILWRNEGRPYAVGDGFKDVAKGMYYTDAVKWAVSKGIVKGYGDGTFRPDEPVSLEELAAIMFRYAAHKNLDTTARGGLSVYNDSDEIAQWAKSAMSWAEAYNMIDGIVGGRLKPAGAATRAQAAAMLARLPKVEEEQTAMIIPGGNVGTPYDPPSHI